MPRLYTKKQGGRARKITPMAAFKGRSGADRIFKLTKFDFAATYE
jgi:hypothetical protein